MLFVGVISFVFGPSLMSLTLGLFGTICYAAAQHPVLIVFCAWVVLLLKHSAVQRLGISMGLDKDEDGDVDWLDAILFLHEAIEGTRFGRWLQLDKVHSILHTRLRLGRTTTFAQKIDKIERFLDEQHGMSKFLHNEAQKTDDFSRLCLV